MATRTLKPLSSESAIALANRAAAGRALGIVLLRLPEDAAEDAFNVVVCGLVFVRQGGFMVIMPFDEEVKSIIEVMGSEHEIAPLFHAGQVECETTRGKNMGTFPCLLVDFPWEMVEHFVAGSSAKSGDMKDLRALQFAGTGTLLRAGKDSSFQLASAWIGSHMPEEVAQDYLTGEEQDEREDEEELQEAPPNGAPLPSQVSALQQRIKELEAQLNQDPSAAVQLHPKLGVSSKAPPLFGPAAPTSSLSAQDWNRLQRLAGPPPKMHASEMRRPAPGVNTTAAENIYAGLDREAEEAGPVNQQLELLGQIDANADPLHKLMFAQLQQNQILLQKLVQPRHHDPVLSALDGGSASGGGSGSGVRGCMAREVFVRSMSDLSRIAQVVEGNAAKELGLTPEKVDMNLMRKYAERRMPLAENRLLTYITFLLTDAWSVGYSTGNVDLMGAVSKILVFVEQTCLDSGRMQLSWLLTGQQEPPFQILMSNRKRVGLQPFSRLAAPVWISANLAYVKDLDTLESKVLAVGNGNKIKEEDPNADTDPSGRPKKPPKTPKAKPGKGKDGKGGDSSTEAV